MGKAAPRSKSGGNGREEPREPRVADYAGILDPKDAKKRIKRKAKAEGAKPVGRPKGSFCLRTQLRKTGEKLRGNRPLYELMIEALYDAAIRGDRDFNSAPSKLIIEHLAGKPMQTIVTNPADRDGYAHLTDEELLRIAGMSPLAPDAREERSGDGGES